MNNRELLKKAIRKLVLQEITLSTNNVGTTDTLPDEAAEKALKKLVPDDSSVQKRPGSSKTTASGKHQIAMSRNSDDSYDVVSITNGSDRRTAKNLKLEEVNEFVKKHATDTEVSYTEKAFNKTSQGSGLKKEDDKEDDDSDETEEVKEKTQLKTADDNTEKADVKADKKLAPVDADNAPQLGGKVVDKLETIIDRVLKNQAKADGKSSFLKVDSKMKSPNKLTAKLKDTPALKEKK